MISPRLTLLFAMLFALSCNNRNHVPDFKLKNEVYPVILVPTYGYNNESSFTLSLEKGVSIRVISEIDPSIEVRINGIEMKTDSVLRINSESANLEIRKKIECLKANPLAIDLALSREDVVDNITVLVYGAGAFLSKSVRNDQLNNIEIGHCLHHQKIYFDYYRTNFQVRLFCEDSVLSEQYYSTLAKNDFPFPNIDFSNLGVGKYLVEFNFGNEQRDTLHVEKHF